MARLPVYLRALTTLSETGTTVCSSEDLAAAAGVNSAKLRKDLSYLGSYGTRGVGYDVDYLRYQIAREMGATRDWPVVIVGIGNLGHALANYSGFRSRGFRVVALLDADDQRHGEVVAGVVVRPFSDLHAIVGEQGVAIGVIATPAASAQDVADQMVDAGITSILNFAPTVLNVGADVAVSKVDLSKELQVLAYHEQRKATQQETRMTALVVGISHRSAPIALLERSPSTPTAPPSSSRTSWPTPTCPRRRSSPPATGWRSTPPSTGSTAVSRTSPSGCWPPPVRVSRPCFPTSTSTTTTAPSPTCSGWPPDSTRWPSASPRSSVRPARPLSLGQEQGSVGPGPQHPVPAGTAGGQAGPRRDRHRPCRADPGLGRPRPGRGRPDRSPGAGGRRRSHVRAHRRDRRTPRGRRRRRGQPHPSAPTAWPPSTPSARRR